MWIGTISSVTVKGVPHLFHLMLPCPHRAYISITALAPASLLPCLRLCLHSPCRDAARRAHAWLVTAARLLRTGSSLSPLSSVLSPRPCSSSRVATLTNSLANSAFPLYPCRDLMVPHCAQYTHLFTGVFPGSKTFFYLLPNCLL